MCSRNTRSVKPATILDQVPITGNADIYLSLSSSNNILELSFQRAVMLTWQMQNLRKMCQISLQIYYKFNFFFSRKSPKENMDLCAFPSTIVT